MRKSPITAVLTVAVLAIGMFVYTLVAGNEPNLGLDLQGGVSVVLQPVTDGDVEVTDENLEQTKQIITSRVDAIGVAEPEVTVQGSTVVVQIPGIKDQQSVLDLVGRTAEMRFRPVLEPATPAPPADAQEQVDELRADLGVPDGVSAQDVADDEAEQTRTIPAFDAEGEFIEDLRPGDPVPEGAVPASPIALATPELTETLPTTTTTTTTVPEALGPALGDDGAADGESISDASADGDGTGGGRSAKAVSARTQSDDDATTTTTTVPVAENTYGVNVYDERFQELLALEAQLDAQSEVLTAAEDDDPAAEVVLLGRADEDGVVLQYKLGPTLLTGRAIEDASAGLAQNGQWEVRPVFRSGADGIDLFNQAASICYSGGAECPGASPQADGSNPGQLAIVLDGEVISAPTINSPSFERDVIQISGSFDESDAKDLALSLRYGALPITLEPQTVQTVSATLGSGALDAGIIAGLVGIAVVAIYILAYYRLLGLVTLGSLALSSMFLWSIISFLGERQGLTLTLAGIVGIIVSIGVSIDSSIVFFEHTKEDVRKGRTLRSVVEGSFATAYRTIVKADISSLLGAVILYLLSVGPVRGFAFYLGLATLLDLIMSYFVVRPVTILLARSKWGQRPELFGIPLDSTQDAAAPPVAASIAGGEQ